MTQLIQIINSGQIFSRNPAQMYILTKLDLDSIIWETFPTFHQINKHINAVQFRHDTSPKLVILLAFRMLVDNSFLNPLAEKRN